MGSEYRLKGEKGVMEYYDKVEGFLKSGVNLRESMCLCEEYDKRCMYGCLKGMDD